MVGKKKLFYHTGVIPTRDYYVSSSKKLKAVNLFRDQGTFRSFVGAIRADGGGDGPEDIMGGLKKTFWNLSWREEASKVSGMSYK